MRDRGAGGNWHGRVRHAGKGSHRFAFEVSVDFTGVEKAGVTREELRGVPEAIGGEPRFGEDVTFDIAGHGFRISV